jgi:hypothetical protein
MDIATLEIHVNSNDLVTAKSNLDALAGSAANADAKFSGSSTNMAASVRKQAEAAQSAGAAVRSATDATASFGDANLQAAEAAAHHSITLGRVERSLESFIVKTTGANEQIGLLAAAFGHLEIGAVAMIGVLGGVFAVLKGYELLTEDARKAKEEQDKLTEALHKWRLEQDNGPAGKLVDEINAAKKAIEELKKTLASTDQSGNPPFLVQLKAQLAGLFAGLSGDPNAIGAAMSTYIRKWYADQVKAIDEGGKDVAAATKEAARLELEALKQDFNDRQAAFLAFLPNEALTIGAKETIEALNNQLAAMQRVAAQNGKDYIASQDAARLDGLQGVALAELTAYLKAEAAQLEANATLSGVALTERLAGIDADKQAALARAKVAEAISLENERLALNAQLRDQANKTAAKNSKDFIDQLQKEGKAWNDLTQSIDDTIGKGALRITQASSFKQAFDEIGQTALKVADDIQKRWATLADNQKVFAKSMMDDARNIAAAIGGGVIGYTLGQQGQLGQAAAPIAGAIQGAEIGGPIGALVGSFAGVIGGMLGAAEAHKQAAEALKAAGDQLQDSLKTYGAPSGIAGQLAQNDATRDKLQQQAVDDFKAAVKANDIGAGNRAISQYQQAGATHDANVNQIAQQFSASLDQQLNSLGGPAGALQNGIDAATKAFQDNLNSATALAQAQGKVAVDQDTLNKIAQIYGETLQQLQADYQQAQVALQANQDARQAAAQGDADGAAILRKQAQDQQEYYDAVKNVYTDAQLAQLKYIQGLEEVALAAAQAAAKLSQSATDIENAVSGGFITGASGLAGEAALFGFTGLSDADIRAKYTDPTLGALTDAQRTLNAQITQYLNDEAKWGPQLATAAGALAGTGPAGSGGSGGSANLQRQAIASAAAGLTQTTGNRMADYLASILIVEKEIRDDIRGTSGYTLNRTATPIFASPSSARSSPSQTTDVAGARSVVIQNLNINMNPKASPTERAFALEIARAVKDEVNKELGDDYANQQLRAGNPNRTGL